MTTVAEMVTYAERVEAMRRAGIWTPEEAARFDALRAAEFCLVRNDGAGERWLCGQVDPVTRARDGCGGKHEFFTKHCVPKPFRGLLHGLYAYWMNVGDAQVADLSPGQLERLEILAPIFGGRPALLSAAHPATATALGTAERDALVGGTLLGSIEPISKAKARLYMDLINMKAGYRILTLDPVRRMA